MSNRVNTTITYISIITAVTISLLIIIELSCGLFLKFLPILSGVYSHGFRHNYSDYRVESPAYIDKSYANEIYKEFLSIQTEYTPYLIWRYKEFHGKHTNIDQNGIRATIPNGKGGKKLFFFGGSTMWGSGVVDSNTIPSIVSRYLNKDNSAYEIVNYGQSGYQSTQEVIQLILEIQRGNIPDIVIFYDGMNDIYASVFSPGIVSYHQNFEQIKNKLEAKGISGLYFNSNLFMFVVYVKNRFSREILRKDDNEDKKIEDAIDLYVANIGLVQKLSKEYNFKLFSFWQPLLLADGKKLTEYEETEKLKRGGGELIRIYTKAYDVINKKHFDGVNFINLSDIFKNETDNIYIDIAHLSDKGNLMVAREIFRQIKREIHLEIR